MCDGDPDLEIVAHVVVLAAQIHPRDLMRARRGMHRRMYVDAATLVSLVDALEQAYPGLIARQRAGADG